MSSGFAGHRARVRPASPHGRGGIFLWLNSAAIVGMLIFSLFGPMLGARSEHGTGEGSALRQGLYVLAFALALVAARPWQRPSNLLVVPLTVVVALGWCWLSLAWSIDPGVSIRRLVLTTMLILTIFLAVSGAGYLRTVTLMRWVLVALLLSNYVSVLLFPTTGIHLSYDASDPGLIGAWRGVLGHKNFAGAAVAVTILLFVFDARHIAGWLRIAVLVLAAIFLYYTQSKTSAGILVAAILAGWFFLRYNPAYGVLFLPVIAIIGTLATYLLETRLRPGLDQLLSNRDAFTGRTEIWAPMLAYLADHPLGSGFGAFWNVGNAREPIRDYAVGWVAIQTSGHNGYLDLAVQVGLPGLGLALIALFAAPIARLAINRAVPRSQIALLASMLIFAMGHNFTESSLFERDIIVHVFLIFAIAMVHQATGQRLLTNTPR